ncbi:peroxisomal targeting signal receptor [Bipolaris maydis]|nr:peroxisomal targeting signal receptor [Bipolaris maydis]
MFLLRRAAARAISASPSKAYLVQPRSIATLTPSTFRPRQQQWSITSFQRRFASDEVSKTDSPEAAAAEASENFAQTAAEAPIEDNLTPAQQEAQAEPTDKSATVGADALEAAATKSSQTSPRGNRERTPKNIEPHNVLYIGNLYYEVTPDQLKRVFSRFGDIESVRMVYDNRGLSRGFAYVEYKNVSDAQAAIDNLDMQVFEGRNLVVQYHSPKYQTTKARSPNGEPNPPTKTLFIGNMSFEMSDKDLNDLFRDIRNVTDVRVAIDRRTGQPRGFAHADFIDVASATRAKEVLKEKIIYGRQLRVDFSTSNTQTQRQKRQDSQFTKHVQDDKSLQRDRLVGRGPGGMQEGMRSQQMGGPSDGMMNEFMNQNVQLPQGPGPASPFAMEQMRRELERAQHSGSPAWAAEFDPGMQAPQMGPAMQERPAGFNPAEFAKFQQMNPTARTASPTTASQPSMSAYQQPMYGMGMGMGMGGMGMGMGMMQQPYAPQNFQQPVQDSGKGKGRMVELDDHDWEAQFAQLEQTDQQNLDALDEEANKAMEAELNEMDRSVEKDAVDFDDFESVWKGIQAETEYARQLANEERFVEGHMGDIDQWEGFDGLNTHPVRDPSMGDYLFEQENLFKNVTNPFEEGVKIMEEGGNLSLAALAFEAAVQKDPNHIAAWVRLGEAQAQNEKETPAIRALEHALKQDPSNLEALMGLAVSYTNEGYESTAYRTLERWLATKYPSLIKEPLSSDAEMGFTDRHLLHEKVTNLFIQAAQLSPSGEQMDPDVQVGLGVLFYGVEEYEKAVDCFGAALASTESGVSNSSSQVHLLWNRLGATLANSGRSEEAIDAYSRALALRPNFVRARYNLGVSCINIGCYTEAAQHLLGALAMHKVVEREGKEKAREVVGDGVSESQLDNMIHQNQSTNLYDTLRRVFGQMGRRDLSDIVGPGMDVERFRGEFEF